MNEIKDFYVSENIEPYHFAAAMLCSVAWVRKSFGFSIDMV